MLLIMKDIRKEQREEQHTISLINNQGWKINKTILHQKLYQILQYIIVNAAPNCKQMSIVKCLLFILFSVL